MGDVSSHPSISPDVSAPSSELALFSGPEVAKTTPNHLSYPQVLSLGYDVDDYYVFSIGFTDEDGQPVEVTYWLLGFKDERGRPPGFCYLTAEGFPDSGRVIPRSYVEQEREFRGRVEVGTHRKPEGMR